MLFLALLALLAILSMMGGEGTGTITMPSVTQKKLTVLQAPRPSQLKSRASEHVGTDHKGATEKAWEAIRACGTSLIVYNCQYPKGDNPPGWTYICALDEAKTMCAVGHAGYAYSELTAWIMHCTDAMNLSTVCYITNLKGD